MERAYKNHTDFGPHDIRKDFPIFKRKIRGKPLIYLDNAATSQKPRTVIDAEKNFYESTNANIHRAVHLKYYQGRLNHIWLRMR